MKNLITTIAAFLVLAFNNLNAQNIPVTASNEDGAITLQWSTPKEVNSSYFMIESSNDNLNFVAVGKVKAAGYSIQAKSYAFEGPDATMASVYYRVTLVSMEGVRNSSLAVNLKEALHEDLMASR